MNDHHYLSALGLSRHPFPVAPDDEYFYVSEHIEQVIGEIVHGISTRKGFMVLGGDVGLGKTTITRRIMRILAEKQIHTSLVFHTSFKDVALLREINRDFGIRTETANPDNDQFGDQLQCLNDFLMAQYQQGRNCAIIIDDAQNLDRASLELVRMISNLEADQQKMVQILLVGQPELMEGLSRPELRQLRSRIIIQKTVQALTHDELRTYVSFKLNLAGSQGRITVTRDAHRRLYRYTSGNFRFLNILMDRCLYVLCDQNIRQIDGRCVQMAYGDLFPQKRPWHRGALALAAAAIFALIIAGTGWMAYDRLTPTAEAETLVSQRYHPMPSPHAVLPAHAPSQNQDVAADLNQTTPPPKTLPDADILRFLTRHQLERYAADLEKAIQEDDLQSLTERIRRESGYQLVQLASLAEQVRQHYGALAISQPPDSAQSWLLLWQPPLALQRFHYQYQGEEIRRLQEMLVIADMYHHRLDGIVGAHMMKAVLAFQDQKDLPVTGYPDAATIFSLFNQHKDS